MKAANWQWDEESTGDVSSEIVETLAKIKEQEEWYKIDANEQLKGLLALLVRCCRMNQEKVKNDEEKQEKKKRNREKTIPPR